MNDSTVDFIFIGVQLGLDIDVKTEGYGCNVTLWNKDKFICRFANKEYPLTVYSYRDRHIEERIEKPDDFKRFLLEFLNPWQWPACFKPGTYLIKLKGDNGENSPWVVSQYKPVYREDWGSGWDTHFAPFYKDLQSVIDLPAPPTTNNWKYYFHK